MSTTRYVLMILGAAALYVLLVASGRGRVALEQAVESIENHQGMPAFGVILLKSAEIPPERLR
jgi:hypothetical protein